MQLEESKFMELRYRKSDKEADMARDAAGKIRIQIEKLREIILIRDEDLTNRLQILEAQHATRYTSELLPGPNVAELDDMKTDTSAPAIIG
jgi:hypothetical protein